MSRVAKHRDFLNTPRTSRGLSRSFIIFLVQAGCWCVLASYLGSCFVLGCQVFQTEFSVVNLQECCRSARDPHPRTTSRKNLRTHRSLASSDQPLAPLRRRGEPQWTPISQWIDHEQQRASPRCVIVGFCLATRAYVTLPLPAKPPSMSRSSLLEQKAAVELGRKFLPECGDH